MFNWFSHGGGMNAEAVETPGSPLVVEYAPQLELLAKAEPLPTQVSTLCSIRSAMGYLWLPSQSLMNSQNRESGDRYGEVILNRLSIPRLRANDSTVLTEDLPPSCLEAQAPICQSGE